MEIATPRLGYAAVPANHVAVRTPRAAFKSAVWCPSVNQSYVSLRKRRASPRPSGSRVSVQRLVATFSSGLRPLLLRDRKSSFEVTLRLDDGIGRRAREEQLTVDPVQFGQGRLFASPSNEGEGLCRRREPFLDTVGFRQRLRQQAQEVRAPLP
jgi:hypothetical protein